MIYFAALILIILFFIFNLIKNFAKMVDAVNLLEYLFDLFLSLPRKTICS